MSVPRLALICFSFALYELPTADAVEPWKPQKVLATVAISTSGEPICLLGTAGGEKIRFLLDTGATHTVLDTSILKKPVIRRTMRLKAGTSTYEAAMYDSPLISVAGLQCPWIKEIAAFDLDFVRFGTGVDVYGILGMDVLARFVLHIDTDNGVLLFCDPAEAHDPPGTKLPMRLDAMEGPLTELTAVGREVVAFKIDTGCLATGQISKEIVGRARQLSVFNPAGAVVPGHDVVGEKLYTQRVKCSVLELGNLSNKNLVFAVSSENVLGLYFLCRFQTTLDFTRGVVVFNPGDKFKLGDRQDFLGLTLSCPEEGRFVVSRVHPGGLGSKCGFRDGDLLLSIGFKPIAELTTPEVMRLLGYPRKDDLIFSVQRGKLVEHVTVPGG